MTEQLDDQRVEALIADLSGWQLGHDSRDRGQPNVIYKSVKHTAFAEGMAMAQQIASAAIGAEDHIGLSIYGFPEHTNVSVLIRTYNDETGPPFGVTAQDIALARDIEAVLSRSA